ncbi:hypothetical protein JDV02_009179 [Purpureocillium takamizusanense]|uniref:Heat-labile enterotoxin IIA, A chain n=1 Tax=Purpureocillium takamizusanense TaxID=2060973 RepID=A0A9Q8QNE5_9HYPO|nr:uncharacterized protein JDV02_009179 [Purpureocillium takamizusanense]UNI23353.1 hypothetical protein JDV02_009179 [Purpureocillium takamizusanense]
MKTTASLWVPWLLPFQLITLGLCHPSARHPLGATLQGRGLEFDDEFPEYVYRGEVGRSPTDVKKEGGFYSRGLQKQQAGQTFSVLEANEGSSLFRHAAGDTDQYTRYVSTSADPGVALTFALDDDRPKDTGYVYKIHADRRMIDVNRSLGKFSPYPAQKEHAAIGFIPFEQVVGWYPVTFEKNFANPELGKKTQKEIREGKLKSFRRNSSFDLTKFQALTGSGAIPQLAGFSRWSTAWEDNTWRLFRDESVEKNLDGMITLLCSTGKSLKRSEACRERLGFIGGPYLVAPHHEHRKKPHFTEDPADRERVPGRPGGRDGGQQSKSVSRVRTSIRVHANAATMLGFTILAPYLHEILDSLSKWDNFIGHAVKYVDDSINHLQTSIGGPPRTDISGNDNQAFVINFFKRVFGALQSLIPGASGTDNTELLSYGQKRLQREVAVNAILRTCDYADADHPDNQSLSIELDKECAAIRQKVKEIEDEPNVATMRHKCHVSQSKSTHFNFAIPWPDAL